ncbi:hypothetical protein E2562_035252 [Oryza meyeriana var. granulata]|uniref:Uncharacterized protein n=1 Tax=Oryza meyeriana var. granulata TaxID=110450 RepID=A0A6G1F1L4_9ORYZ|nr:hypothetical protein E2562_035252 [Oryza meyeriana var. granulata]
MRGQQESTLWAVLHAGGGPAQGDDIAARSATGWAMWSGNRKQGTGWQRLGVAQVPASRRCCTQVEGRAGQRGALAESGAELTIAATTAILAARLEMKQGLLLAFCCCFHGAFALAMAS